MSSYTVFSLFSLYFIYTISYFVYSMPYLCMFCRILYMFCCILYMFCCILGIFTVFCVCLTVFYVCLTVFYICLTVFCESIDVYGYICPIRQDLLFLLDFKRTSNWRNPALRWDDLGVDYVQIVRRNVCLHQWWGSLQAVGLVEDY